MAEEIQVYEPTKMCGVCGGKCCQHLPGAVFPSDCGEDVEAGLWSMMQTGNYIFDYWEGQFEDFEDIYTPYYFRPKTKEEEGSRNIRNGTWGGPCTFLTPQGCTLKFEQRPLNCRMLKPKETVEGKCTGTDDAKTDAIRAWIPHNELIEKLIERWYAENA